MDLTETLMEVSLHSQGTDSKVPHALILRDFTLLVQGAGTEERICVQRLHKLLYGQQGH
jgi:hypothetical protein